MAAYARQCYWPLGVAGKRLKMFFTSNVWCSLRLLPLKLKGKQYKQNPSPKGYKSEIKILANPGLALPIDSHAGHNQL